MKKKILFLVDYWEPKPTANTVCVKNVAEELKKMGWDIYISAYKNKKDCGFYEECGCHISFIRPNLSRRLLEMAQQDKNIKKRKVLGFFGKVLNRIRRLLLLPIYPICSVGFSNRWCRQAQKIMYDNDISFVVSTYAPADSTYTGYLIKKKYPNAIWVPYYIDNGSNVLTGTTFEKTKRILQEKAIRWENKVFSKAECIIIMEGHEKYYANVLTASNKEKIIVKNVPLLSEPFYINKRKIHSLSEKETWVYTGSMKGTIYDPHTICEFFAKYQENKNAELHLYGLSDQEKYLLSLNEKNIFWHGMIAHDKIDEVLMNADVLIYYINTRVDSVSGKLFEYIKYGKPIIYIGPKDDINVKNLKKYPIGLAIDIEMTKEKIVRCIEVFLSSGKNIPLSQKEICECFEKNTPASTAKAIDEIYRMKCRIDKSRRKNERC